MRFYNLLISLFLSITVINAQTVNWSSVHPDALTNGTNTFSAGSNAGSIVVQGHSYSCSGNPFCEGGDSSYGYADDWMEYNTREFTFYDAGGVVVPLTYNTPTISTTTSCAGRVGYYYTHSWSGGSYAVVYVKEEICEDKHTLYVDGVDCYYDLVQTCWTNYPFGTPPTPLPVELISFDAFKKDKKTELAWTTATEINVSHYDIEKSTDTKVWKRTGNVPALNNGTTSRHYTYIDETPLETITYYRLKMVDLDGTYKYSPIVSAEGDFNNRTFTTYPNPATDEVFVVLPRESETITIQVYDVVGKELVVESEKINSNKWIVNTTSLPKGAYFINATTPNKIYTNQVFIKN